VRDRQRQAAKLEAANVRAEIAERNRLSQAIELEARNCANRRPRTQLQRRIAQRTLAGLVAALVLAAIALASGLYARSQTIEGRASEGRNREAGGRSGAAEERGAEPGKTCRSQEQGGGGQLPRRPKEGIILPRRAGEVGQFRRR
jgi:hypothetical protein